MRETQEQTTKDDGGPAFASFERVQEWYDNDGKYREHYLPVEGMKLRDYFAAKALAGIMANGTSYAAKAAKEHGCSVKRVVAMTAYDLADAMLEVRAERQKERG